MTEQMKVIVKCPNCGWRMLDKVTPASGCISIKCQRCRQVVSIDLSLRRRIRYRRVRTYRAAEA